MVAGGRVFSRGGLGGRRAAKQFVRDVGGKDSRGGGSRRVERRVLKRTDEDWEAYVVTGTAHGAEKEEKEAQSVELDGNRGSAPSNSSNNISQLEHLLRRSSSLPPKKRKRRADGIPRELESLTRDFDEKLLMNYFSKRMFLVGKRFAEFMAAALKVYATNRLVEDPAEWRRVLREELTRLGPVCVKMGQTMSQREDLVGEELAEELKTLQEENEPFDSAIAWSTIRDELDWKGPIAPGVGDTDAPIPNSKPLFQKITPEPVAAASLGQVYRGTMWDGREVAIKVQRPGLFNQVAQDIVVLRFFLIFLRESWGDGPNLTFIADSVGEGVFRELDYTVEAANAREFEEKHAFLGFVKVPKCLDELTTKRVLVMEWVYGQKLGELNEERAKKFVGMAIEASAAQLLKTGMVHADPHEGNIIMDPQGNLVFIDFGLVSYVENRHAEAFSSGIIHLLAANWTALAYDFVDMDFLPEDFVCIDEETDEWVPCSVEKFCDAISSRMGSYVSEESGKESTENGKLSRGFGDLVEIFSSMSSTYRFNCPPYSIILARSYATLEGIAEKVDPTFNVYEACMPYAVRRGLAPRTEKYKLALRESLLTDDGHFKWNQLIESLEKAAATANVEVEPEAGIESEAAHDDVGALSGSTDTAGIVSGIIGAKEGNVLRKTLWDADSASILNPLLLPHGELIRNGAIAALREEIKAKLHQAVGKIHLFVFSVLLRQKCSEAATSSEATEVVSKDSKRVPQVIKLLLMHHVRQLLGKGVAGAAILGLSSLAAAWLVVVATTQALFSFMGDILRGDDGAKPEIRVQPA